DVLADRVAGHVVEGLVLPDPVGAAADDDDQLDLPVDLAAWRQLDVTTGTGDAARELGEHWGLGGRGVVAGLGGVLAVVQADAEYLSRCGRGRAERLRPDRRPVGELAGRGPRGEGAPDVVDGLRVGAELAAAALLHVVADLMAGLAGHDHQPAVQVGDTHRALLLEFLMMISL